jgi:hypothetical protein
VIRLLVRPGGATRGHGTSRSGHHFLALTRGLLQRRVCWRVYSTRKGGNRMFPRWLVSAPLHVQGLLFFFQIFQSHRTQTTPHRTTHVTHTHHPTRSRTRDKPKATAPPPPGTKPHPETEAEAQQPTPRTGRSPSSLCVYGAPPAPVPFPPFFFPLPSARTHTSTDRGSPIAVAISHATARARMHDSRCTV